MIVYGILQKDFVLYLGIKLGMSNQGKVSAVGSAAFKVSFLQLFPLFTIFFKGLSKILTKLVILVLQVTIFILAQAATTSTTKRSCNSIDFVGDTFGYVFYALMFVNLSSKIIVAFFYILFYFMFFFIFTGAPDWPKYAHLGGFKASLLITVDGIRRFSSLTTGVWTDDTGKTIV